MALKTSIFFLSFVLPELIVAQIYPTNLTMNGCKLNFNSFITPDTINCFESKYVLEFEDNFDSTDLDESKWQRSYPWGRSLKSPNTSTGYERQYYTDENVRVSEGFLHLTTKVDPGARSPDGIVSGIFFNYTSGMVFSKVAFSRGKFEAKCKIPKLMGLWPAFWFYGPCSQEIDIFEFTNETEVSEPSEDGSNVIMTYHQQNDCNDTSKGMCRDGFIRKYDIDYINDFHIYSVEWNENKIVWKIDGKEARAVYRLWSVDNNAPEVSIFQNAWPVKTCAELEPETRYSEFSPWPKLDVPVHLILNTAVSKDRAQKPGALPQEFLIDYVRVYKEVETLNPVERSDAVDFATFPNPFSGTFSIPAKVLGQEIETITIRDVLGNDIMFLLKEIGDHYDIDMSLCPKGLYVVKVTSNGRIFLKKVLHL